ncbi:MAG: FAD-binding oxidoreductase, partial [Polyangiaceae bacterium]
DDNDERTPTPAGSIDDASRLNRTKVEQIVQVSPDRAEAQLQELLQIARKKNLKIAIAGARHSQGGHTIYPGGIALDMLPFKRMKLDEQRNVLQVGAGARWQEIIPYLDAAGRSVAIMQSNNSFSVGGSISVNCHGWQFDRPPIASSVVTLELLKADGSIVRCSRTENPKLFSLVLGGYGLFGIILNVELRVVANKRYGLEQIVVPAAEGLAAFDEQIRQRPDVAMVYARLSIVPDSLFDEVIINLLYEDPDGDIPKLGEPGLQGVRRALFRGSANSDYGKKLRWNAEAKLQPFLKNRVFSRNQLLNEGVEVFESRKQGSTDILHEYFVPRDRAADFVGRMGEIIAEQSAALLNVTVRSVNTDSDSFLHYASEPMLAFVMLFTQPITETGEADMQTLTRSLIDAAIEHGGRYYLPYRLHATVEQFHRAYPQARAFFEAKRRHDPDELFQNQLYLKYGK